MRRILHDWSERYAVIISENLVPAMKTGTRILLFEYVLQEEPVMNATSSFGLRMDMIMGIGFNAKERTTNQMES
jgi:hypothetical protein